MTGGITLTKGITAIPGSDGTVTLLEAGANITLTPDPIVETGSIAVSESPSFEGTTTVEAIQETKTALSITANVLTVDVSLGTVFTVTSNANISTFTLSNAPSGPTAFTLIITANGSGFTQNWGAVKWAGAVAPILTTTNGKIDILTFVWDGVNWYGLTAGQNF